LVYRTTTVPEQVIEREQTDGRIDGRMSGWMAVT